MFQSVYIQRNPALRPPRLYDHLLPQLTSHSLSTQTWKSPSHFIILKTSLMRPPRYHDQDFMVQRWSHHRGSTVFFNFSFPHCRTKKKQKKCASISSRRVTRLSELPMEEVTFHTFTYWKHGEPFILQKVGSARRVTHFVQSPFCNGTVSLLAGPTFLRGTLHAFHWTKIPVWNFGKATCPVEGTFQLQRPNQSHREFGYRACKQDTDHWSWWK